MNHGRKQTRRVFGQTSIMNEDVLSATIQGDGRPAGRMIHLPSLTLTQWLWLVTFVLIYEWALPAETLYKISVIGLKRQAATGHRWSLILTAFVGRSL